MTWGWSSRGQADVAVGGSRGTPDEAKIAHAWPSYEAKYLAQRLATKTGKYDSDGLNDVQTNVYLDKVAEDYKTEADECLRKEFYDWLQGKHAVNAEAYYYDNKKPGNPSRLKVIRDETGSKVAEKWDDTLDGQWNPTWWGQNALTHLPGVREHLRENEKQKMQADLQMNLLAEFGPQNLEQAWMYFKHWVKGRPVGVEECMLGMTNETFSDGSANTDKDDIVRSAFGNMPGKGFPTQQRGPKPKPSGPPPSSGATAAAAAAGAAAAGAGPAGAFATAAAAAIAQAQAAAQQAQAQAQAQVQAAAQQAAADQQQRANMQAQIDQLQAQANAQRAADEAALAAAQQAAFQAKAAQAQAEKTAREQVEAARQAVSASIAARQAEEKARQDASDQAARAEAARLQEEAKRAQEQAYNAGVAAAKAEADKRSAEAQAQAAAESYCTAAGTPCPLEQRESDDDETVIGFSTTVANMEDVEDVNGPNDPTLPTAVPYPPVPDDTFKQEDPGTSNGPNDPGLPTAVPYPPVKEEDGVKEEIKQSRIPKQEDSGVPDSGVPLDASVRAVLDDINNTLAKAGKPLITEEGLWNFIQSGGVSNEDLMQEFEKLNAEIAADSDPSTASYVPYAAAAEVKAEVAAATATVAPEAAAKMAKDVAEDAANVLRKDGLDVTIVDAAMMDAAATAAAAAEVAKAHTDKPKAQADADAAIKAAEEAQRFAQGVKSSTFFFHPAGMEEAAKYNVDFNNPQPPAAVKPDFKMTGEQKLAKAKDLDFQRQKKYYQAVRQGLRKEADNRKKQADIKQWYEELKDIQRAQATRRKGVPSMAYMPLDDRTSYAQKSFRGTKNTTAPLGTPLRVGKEIDVLHGGDPSTIRVYQDGMQRRFNERNRYGGKSDVVNAPIPKSWVYGPIGRNFN